MYSKSTMKQRILLTGKDGIDLLQRITTIHFQRLSINLPQPGLILNPQGKILCYFEVTNKGVTDQVEITFQDSFMELLEQYTFGERYKIEKLAVIEEICSAEQTLKRIQSRIPKLGNEFLNNGESNPLEINLETAIHDQKGCYPGQEVIEKIIAIGSPAKKLCLVKCLNQSPLELPLPLDLDHGKLTSYQSAYGLAIVRKTHANPGTVLHSINYSFQVIES
jgi:folate-binding protein YgfZ